MRCGTKQFVVTFENIETKEIDERVVYARTPADARKQLRLMCGKETSVRTVKAK